MLWSEPNAPRKAESRLELPPRRRQTLPNGFDFTDSPSDVLTSASVDAPNELSLTLTRQDEFIYASQAMKSVTISTPEGKMGVLPGHEYVVEKLVAGIIEVENNEGKVDKFATSGGFAHINTDGSVDLQTAEAIPLSAFDLPTVEKELVAAQ
eukprot:gene6359-9743_t